MHRTSMLFALLAIAGSLPAHAQEAEWVPPPAYQLPPQPAPAPAAPRAPLPAAGPAATREHWPAAPVPAYRAPPRPAAEVQETDVADEEPRWSDRARFFIGMRAGVGIPAGGIGPAPTEGLEMGVAADHGVGFGLHLITAQNPPAVPALDIPASRWGLGAMADLRWYFQTVEPLTLYPTMSVGFLAGPSRTDGRNAVLPMVNPGFGGRVRIGQVYGAFEFGLAGFNIPFVSLSLGYEPDRKPRK